MSKEYRRETRHTVTVAGRYRARQGGARDVWIKDISEYGCRFFDKFSVLQTEAGILVKVGNVGPAAQAQPAFPLARDGTDQKSPSP
ncbi:MAG: hypothetical protein JKY75_11685 [Erythrobacter sp.]|nr:hypothetical protein [Erythrobacter sp.]